MLRPQFRLRTLFVVTAAIAAWCLIERIQILVQGPNVFASVVRAGYVLLLVYAFGACRKDRKAAINPASADLRLPHSKGP
jgi:hypothetical protein